MAKFLESLEKLLKSKKLILLLAIVIMGFLIYRQSSRSGSYLDNMDNNNTNSSISFSASENNASSFAPIEKTDCAKGLAHSYKQEDAVKAEELLPLDTNTQFSQLNPKGKGPLGDISFLSAGHHLGIDTKGSSLRNANLQIRSEPTIPKRDIGPFLNSTIEPDTLRPILEIGNQSTCS